MPKVKLSGFGRNLQQIKEELLESQANNEEPEKELPWSLSLGPQTLAAESEADEVYFGGKAGGGKSALLLLLAATRHRRSIVFRRVYPNLKGLIEKSKELLTGIARYNSNDKMWRGIPGDRTLEFGAMEHEDDKEKYRGQEHDGKFYDELTEISQSQFEFTSGWCRTTIPDQHCQIVATFNPPNSRDGLWIIKKLAPWLDPKYPGARAEPGEIRWFIRDRETNEEIEVSSGDLIEYKGETLKPRSRTFIPSSLEDNPYLRDSNYRSMLQSLPEPLRSQLLYGDFSLVDQDDAWQVIPTAWVRAAIARWESQPMARYDVLGVDVSRGGDDETVIAPRERLWIDELRVYPGSEIPDGDVVAGHVINHLTSKETVVNIDVIGPGCSPYDSLKRICTGEQRINGLNSSEASVDDNGERKTDRTGLLGFANRRSEWWWNMRELLDPRYGKEIALPDDDKLLADLTTPRWTPLPVSDPDSPIKSLVEVESKAKMAKRLGGRSPDRGDAVVYAFAPVDMQENPWQWMLNI